jgi:hypothetical protein
VRLRASFEGYRLESGRGDANFRECLFRKNRTKLGLLRLRTGKASCSKINGRIWLEPRSFWLEQTGAGSLPMTNGKRGLAPLTDWFVVNE